MPDTNTNPKSLGRVPIIPLSYDQKDRAVSKELVADYETGNIYIKNANGEMINVFQAALKVDNQWMTSSARLNNNRAWAVVVGNGNSALAAGGVGPGSSFNVVNTVESWDGVSWRVDAIEDFGIPSSNKQYIGGCGTHESMLFARNGAVYLYENGTATVKNDGGQWIPSAVNGYSFDVCGNSTISLFRNSKENKLRKFNSDTGTFSLRGSHTYTEWSDERIASQAFGNVNEAIFCGSYNGNMRHIKYIDTSITFSLVQESNIHRFSFVAIGDNVNSGMIAGGMSNFDNGAHNTPDVFNGTDPVTTDTSEEWLNGTTWRVSGNLGHGLAALDGCGSVQGGIIAGGFLGDGSVSNYTEKYNNVDGITYLKSLRDDIGAIMDAISDKTIGNVFDCYITANADRYWDIVSIAAKQSKAVFAERYDPYIKLNIYNKISKTASLIREIDIYDDTLANPSVGLLTSGISDTSYVFITDFAPNKSAKMDEVGGYTLSNFNPLHVNYYNNTPETTGLDIGIGRIIGQSYYIKYDYNNEISTQMSISPIINRIFSLGGGNQSIAYFCAGCSSSNRVDSLIAEKIESDVNSVIGNMLSAHRFSYYANLMKYGNDFIAYGKVTEKLNTLTNSWSVEPYSSILQHYENFDNAANGNTSALGLGATHVDSSYDSAMLEEIYHGTILGSVRTLVDESSENFNTNKAERIRYSDDIINGRISQNVEDMALPSKSIAGVDLGTNGQFLVDLRTLFEAMATETKIWIKDYAEEADFQNNIYHIPNVPYVAQRELILNVLWYEDIIDDPDIDDDVYVYTPHSYFSSTAPGNLEDNKVKLDKRIRTIENALIEILLGNSPIEKTFFDIMSEKQNNLRKLNNVFNIRNHMYEMLNYIVGNDSSLVGLFKNHEGNTHPYASVDNGGYMTSNHYKLLANATDESTATRLIKRDANGRAKITHINSYQTASTGNGLFIANCYYVHNYFIRNATAEANNPSVTQYLGTQLQALSNTNYNQKQVRNIVFWTSGDMPATANGDIIIKTF